jgi:hypothetical protein
MSQAEAIDQQIQQRFKQLSLSLQRAIDLSGIEVEGRVIYEKTEQADARRDLLRVEKIAIRDRELNKKSEENYVDGIRDLVHHVVLERLEEQLKDLDGIYNKTLGVDEHLPDLIDILSLKASSISRIEPIAASIPWMYDDLIKLVNLPQYRRTDKKGKVVTIDSLRMGLNFLGIDNLRLVVPSLAFRRWIPQITDPYPEIKSRVWEQAIGTAISCKKIAQVMKLDEATAFTLGMFQQIGFLVVVRLYFKLFEQVHREAIIEAHNDKKREEYAALAKIEPSADFLLSLVDKYAMSVSSQIINKMDMRRVFIGNSIDEFAKKIPFKDMSPLSKVLYQGNAYCKYRMLKSCKLIDMDESKEFLRRYQMPPGSLSVLKTTDLRHMNLSFEQDL